MKKSLLFLFLFTSFLLSSCSKNDEDDIIHKPDPDEQAGLDVHDFVYKGLNAFYLYKSDIPELDDDYFQVQTKYVEFLSEYNTPEDLFEALLSDQDRFSFIVPDFHVLEKQLSGITLNNGMEYGLVKYSKDSDNVFGYVRYVLSNTSAEDEGVKRGMIFTEIDGQQLTVNNYSDLLAQETYTISLAKIEENTIYDLDETITLSKDEYPEDPIHVNTTIKKSGHKIGYLLYNAFTSSFDKDLNNVFGDFKSEGITDLVLDLRYNGGGSVASSQALGSMITGQFKDKVFAQEIYNDNFETDHIYFEDKFGKEKIDINSLNLDKVYILTSSSTASASELIINALRPYIDVVQIGTTTTGKFQGSITVYDSKDFLRSSVKPGKTYAMQPLIMKLANADGHGDYLDGLSPDIEIEEDFGNLGVLGDADELFLATAIEDITGVPNAYYKTRARKSFPDFEVIGESKMKQLSFQRMYKDVEELDFEAEEIQ